MENSLAETKKIIDAEFNRPLYLTDEEKENPVLVLEEFYSIYHVKDAEELQWNVTKTANGSDDGEFQEPKHRRDVFFFYENVRRLIQASFLLMKMTQNQERLSDSK